MRVAILFDDVESRFGSTADERGVLESVFAAEEVLAELGHQTVRIPAGSDCGEWSRVLERSSPDVVFNLCEGLGGRSDGEVLAARIVEDLGLPKTGNSSDTLALARRKDRVNALLEELSLPVPPWSVWNGESDDATLQTAKGECPVASWRFFPAIVKPVAEDASVGITQEAVVGESDALSRRLQTVRHLSPLLVQAFVGTREINVGIVGGEVLPLAEILFDDLPRGFHPLVGYEAKWSPGSMEDIGTRPLCPARLTPSVARRAKSLALKVWRAVGGCGYGRVDLRLTEPDTLHVLEVNPNPDLAPSVGLARMAGVAGWTYTEMLQGILAEAVRTSEALV